jgi:hypothetical protein
MELNIRFTARPSPGTGTRVLVLIIIIVVVLLVRKTGYGPGTAVPAATAVLAVVQAAGALLVRSRQASLPGPASGLTDPQ